MEKSQGNKIIISSRFGHLTNYSNKTSSYNQYT